ncbi:MAG: hypothetical protein LBJ02_08005 [Bifidobacteriaceae bacterium]|jgi:hypothetical protein|nr:hypothetical protein [Bifidobacteriaceae bacterium]
MKVSRFAQYVVAALVLGLAVWMALIWWAGSSGAKAYAGDRYQTAEDRYSLGASFMPLERWKSKFGRGTAVLAAGNPSRAEDLLAEALERVPRSKECLVRVNLSLAQERQGDDADGSGFALEAKGFWEAALRTLRDGDCPAKDTTAAAAEQRLLEKLNPPEEEDPKDPEEDGEEPDDGTGQAPDGDEDSPNEGDNPSDEPNDDPSGQPNPAQPSPNPTGDPVDPNDPGKDEEDPAAQDLKDRLSRLNDQNQAGQRERQANQDKGSYGSGRRGAW